MIIGLKALVAIAIWILTASSGYQLCKNEQTEDARKWATLATVVLFATVALGVF